MRYNCTLLKDLPGYPAGTTFRMLEENGKWHVLESGLFIPSTALNSPEWVKKEIDETCLTELKCKSCGSTKMLLEGRYAGYDYDDDVYMYKIKFVGVCTCGCENEFAKFTRHTEVHY